MNFNDTPEEAAFRSEARAFLEEHAPQFALCEEGDMNAAGVVTQAKAWQACKQDHGWACLTWPKEYGGRGASPIQSIIFGQEQSRFELPPDLFTVGTGFMGPAIMTHGTDAQKGRFLTKIARGEEIWCQLFSEPAAGSDLAGIRTTAVRDASGWVLNGQKNWTTGALISDWGVIVSRTDPDVPKHDGLTCFIVDMRSQGVEIQPIRQMDGGADFNEVFLSNVRAPDDLRLGPVGAGWSVAVTVLMHERFTLGTIRSGKAEDLLGTASAVGLADRDDVRQRIADFVVRSAALRNTQYRTLTDISRGRVPGPEASLGKLVASELRQEMASFAVELAGWAGSVDAGDGWNQAYLAAPGMRIAGGTDEILRNILAERVLDLPREPRFDKEVAFREVPSGTR